MSPWHRPVLVIVDVQLAIDDPRWGQRNNPGAEDRIAELLAAFRGADLPVVHVRHDSTEEGSAYRPDRPSHAFKPCARPLDGEPVVPKRTNNAFIGTDLARRLDDLASDAVVYCGVITNNSLEATVRASGNLGYPSVVVDDACWTVDKIDRRGQRWAAADVHELSLANLDGEYAVVLGSDEVIARLG